MLVQFLIYNSSTISVGKRRGNAGNKLQLSKTRIDDFTVVCLVTWPVNESEAGVDLAFIETSLLFLC